MPRLTFENKWTFGNLIQTVVVIATIIWGYASMSGNVAANSRSIGEMQAITATIPGMNTRLTVVESRAETAARRQDEADQRVAAMLDSLQQLTVRAAETGKDVGYLRDWVEEQRRKERIAGVDQ